MLSIEIIPLLRDNYSYFIYDTMSGVTGIIDPASAEPILGFLGDKSLDFILNTHHHWDHTDGNLEIKNKKQAKIIGAEVDQHRIPGIDVCVKDSFYFGNCEVKILHLPGHTSGHIGFFFINDKVLFCGDVLFFCGCGRVFEGTIQEMYNSIQILKSLPDETKIFCGHEYTESNIRFALSIEPNNTNLQRVYKEVKLLRIRSRPTVPSTISQERLINPFFRTSSDEIKRNIGFCSKNSDLEVFTKIRKLKDKF